MGRILGESGLDNNYGDDWEGEEDKGATEEHVGIWGGVEERLNGHKGVPIVEVA